MKDLQAEILNWHVATFGEGAIGSEIADRTLEKLEEEYSELWLTHPGSSDEAEEIADIIIVLLAYAGRMGHDMDAEIRRKFDVVKNRDQRQRDKERGLI